MGLLKPCLLGRGRFCWWLLGLRVKRSQTFKRIECQISFQKVSR